MKWGGQAGEQRLFPASGGDGVLCVGRNLELAPARGALGVWSFLEMLYLERRDKAVLGTADVQQAGCQGCPGNWQWWRIPWGCRDPQDPNGQPELCKSPWITRDLCWYSLSHVPCILTGLVCILIPSPASLIHPLQPNPSLQLFHRDWI